MAAHALTGIRQSLDNVDRAQSRQRVGCGEPEISIWDEMQTALDLSCWTEDIGNHYFIIEGAVKSRDLDRLFESLLLALPSVIDEWFNRGKPRCREEWYGQLDAG